jgi:hypothetical protein
MMAPSPHSHRESHIFPALAVLALLVMLAYLPQRYEIMPHFVQFLIGVALAVPMLAAGFFPTNSLLSRAERYIVVVLLPLAICFALVLLAFILRDMARPHSGVSGLTLLSTSIGIWVTNVLVFALGYWQLDRGGPSGRSGNWRGRADFTFPRGDPSDGVPPDWQPGFADYLSLAFNTSTAFSPTDVLPLTPRAKMLMVLQSAISLVTVITVGARAINILGS